VRVDEIMPLSDITDRITEDFSGLSQILQANVAIVSKIKPRPLPSTYFTIHYSVTDITSSVIIPEMFRASEMKSQN
jgi:hypothetical protein